VIKIKYKKFKKSEKDETLIYGTLLISEKAYLYSVSTLLFGHKNKLQIDLGDLQNEKERMSSFLQSNLTVNVDSGRDKLVVDAEELSVLELQRVVAKYVRRHNLSRTHWVSVEDKTVKINRFKGSEKKKEKHNKSKPHQNIAQSWGL